MSKSKPNVTCWQCQKVFKGETACVSHAKAKKHQWQDPSAPPPSYSPSVSTTTAIPSGPHTATGVVPTAFVASNVVYCPVCFQAFGTWNDLSLHHSIFHTTPYLSRELWYPCSTCQEFVPDKEEHYRTSPRHPKCTACHDSFENAEALQQHLATRETCDVCNAHLLPSVTMEDHYRMSQMHPTCEICWVSFRGWEEFEWHCRFCPPVTTPEPAVDTYYQSNDIGFELPSTPETSHLTEFVAESEGGVDDRTDTGCTVDDQTGTGCMMDDQTDMDGAFWEATATKPSVPTDSNELEEYVPSNGDLETRRVEALLRAETPSVEAVDLEHSMDESSWDRDDSTSSSEGSPSDEETETPTSPAHTEVAQWPFDAESSTEELNTTGNTGHASVSWHCRSCSRDPCEDPVTTVCGHIFCKECIVLALSTDMACPMCEKVFFIKLNLESD